MLGGANEEENKEGTAQDQAVQGWEGASAATGAVRVHENGNPWLWWWQSEHCAVCSEGPRSAAGDSGAHHAPTCEHAGAGIQG